MHSYITNKSIEADFNSSRRAPESGRTAPGRGTRNALIALSDRSHLEIIGPDPMLAETVRPRWFQIDRLDTPRLVTWAVKEADLIKLSAKAKACGIHLGPVVSGTRQRSDGSSLRWRFTDPSTVVADGIVPFFKNINCR